MDTQDFDEGTHLLEDLAEQIESERAHGASAYAVPEDDPDYVDDVNSIEPTPSDEREGGNQGPTVPIRPA